MRVVPSVWLYFYPRPPRGGRRHALFLAASALLFLSTPSARRATPLSAPPSTTCSDFYPRPPRGGRRMVVNTADLNHDISIHALREEGDPHTPEPWEES